MARRTPLLPALTILLAALPLAADRPADAERQDALFRDARGHIATRVFELGLDRAHDFALKNRSTNDAGTEVVRVHQTYRGVRVFEGEAVLHFAGGQAAIATDGLVRGIALQIQPSLEAAEALATAHAALAPVGPYAVAPAAELVIARIETEDRRGRTALRPTLVYHVHTELENGTEETRHTDFFIDAHSGEVLESWDSLHTAAATGSGRSQYSGTVTLNTNLNGSAYELYSTVHGSGIKTYNLNHATTGTGSLYGDADNTWGDGANYVEGSSTTAANGQTAGVDAHYGVEVTWNMYKNVFGRNGIDGTGKATYSRVHYSNSYDNAFWSDSCFCMTYGDGSSFTTLTSMDVAGHEMTHGVTSREANLTYRAESGGLNESMSDIFGTMAEFYRGSSGATIPSTGGNWTIGEQLSSTPLRYMYKPSLDGRSPDAWSSSLKRLDVHYSSGPMNRCFYFLSQGTGTGNYASSYLPGGMTGIGNDKAARIVYKALCDYMTSSTNYAGAKTACLNAATALYGNPSAEYTAVVNAFKAINVN